MAYNYDDGSFGNSHRETMINEKELLDNIKHFFTDLLVGSKILNTEPFFFVKNTMIQLNSAFAKSVYNLADFFGCHTPCCLFSPASCVYS